MTTSGGMEQGGAEWEGWAGWGRVAGVEQGGPWEGWSRARQGGQGGQGLW